MYECSSPLTHSLSLSIYIYIYTYIHIYLRTALVLQCSGIHRNLGVHISFVRSVNLDTWKEEQVDRMDELGNSHAKVIRTFLSVL